MPLIKSAIKKLKQDKKRTAGNKPVRVKLRRKVKEFIKEPKIGTLDETFSTIDKALKKGLIKKNKANRLKSRLSKKIRGEGKTSKTIKTKGKKKIEVKEEKKD